MKRKLYLLFVMLLAVTIIPVSAKTDNFIADESVSLNDPIDATSLSLNMHQKTQNRRVNDLMFLFVHQ